jgi:hypothetical protein
MIEIREIKIGDLEALTQVANADGHPVIRPTHVAIKNGEFVGCASVGAVPLILFYMHTKNASARDTFRMIKYCEDTVVGRGATIGCIPCAVNSPIYPFTKKLGFRSIGMMDLFFKTV